jgi:hypothetical protein
MTYQGVHIYFLNLPFGQGLTVNSKRVIVKPTYDPTGAKVSINVTANSIKHEL